MPVRTFVSPTKKRIMPKEARARIKINKKLKEAGWRLLDDEKGKANVQLETHLPFEHSENFEGLEGYTDYSLLDSKGKYIGVLEAKAEDKIHSKAKSRHGVMLKARCP